MADQTISGLPSDIAMGIPADRAAAAEFEFDTTQNQTFFQLGRVMSFVGVVFMVFGGLCVVGAFAAATNNPIAALPGLLQSAIYLMIGMWTRNAAQGFSRVATTAGSDVTNLMTAMRELLRVYKMLRALLLIAVVGLVIIVFAAAASMQTAP